MFTLRRWCASALVASSIVGTPLVHAAPVPVPGPASVGNRPAEQAPYSLSYGPLHTVAAGKDSTLPLLTLVDPNGEIVTDPEAEGYTFSTEPFTRSQPYKVEESGTVVVTPKEDFRGTMQIRIRVEHPEHGKHVSEHDVHVVSSAAAQATDESMPAFTGSQNISVFRNVAGSEQISAVDRETGQALANLEDHFDFELGSPDPERGWSIPHGTSVDDTGDVKIRANSLGRPGEYVIPVIVTDSATGNTSTVEVNAKLVAEDFVYLGTDPIEQITSGGSLDLLVMIVLFLAGVGSGLSMLIF